MTYVDKITADMEEEEEEEEEVEEEEGKEGDAKEEVEIKRGFRECCWNVETLHKVELRKYRTYRNNHNNPKRDLDYTIE
jgi:hypothetical protein